MKTYRERARDIQARLEAYEGRKRRRRRRVCRLLLSGFCLAVLGCAAAVLPALLRPPVLPPVSGPESPVPAGPGSSALAGTEPVSPPAGSDSGTPHSGLSQKKVSHEEAGEALGWAVVPGTGEDFLDYILLSFGGRPAGLTYRFENGFVRILPASFGDTAGEDGRRVSYRGRDFLVAGGGEAVTALYRDGGLSYTARFSGRTQEQVFDAVLSLLIPPSP